MMINFILKPDTNQQWNNEFNIFPCLPKYIIFFLWQVNIYLTVLLWIISTCFKFDSNNLWKCNKITWRKKLFLKYSVWKHFIFIWKQNLRWSFWFKRFIWRRRDAKQGRGRKKPMAWTQFSLSPAEVLRTNAPIVLQLVSPWGKGGTKVRRGREGDSFPAAVSRYEPVLSSVARWVPGW